MTQRPTRADDLTALLARMNAGDPKAHEELVPLVYAHLRQVASAQLKGDKGHTLEPTGLVHELFLKLHPGTTDFKSRGHFMAVAATAMRQILIDHARRHGAVKRGGDRARVSLSDIGPAEASNVVDAFTLNEALERLQEVDPRAARLVELRVFGGLSQEESAEVLGVSLRTVERDWRRLRAWLAKELQLSGS